jgi:hypothetical protein
MTKDNVTGKNKDFYDLGKKIFDRLNPQGAINPKVVEQVEPSKELKGDDLERAFYRDWEAGKVRRVSDGKRMVPEREWVGLTDEELLDLADMAYLNDLELLQTLQAKLKEKNFGNN